MTVGNIVSSNKTIKEIASLLGSKHDKWREEIGFEEMDCYHSSNDICCELPDDP
jgi:hypothetical protein